MSEQGCHEQSCHACSGRDSCASYGQHSGCGLCCGRRELVLSPTECAILLRFAEMPFFPAGFAENSMTPFCMDFMDLEDTEGACSTALLALWMKMLISIDPGIPLAGFDYSGYSAWPVHGSMALTGYGQTVLEQVRCLKMGEEPC